MFTSCNQIKLSSDRLFLKAINILYHHGILPEHRLMIVAALIAKIAQVNPLRNYVHQKIMQSFAVKQYCAWNFGVYLRNKCLDHARLSKTLKYDTRRCVFDSCQKSIHTEEGFLVFACARIDRLIFDLLLLRKVHWNRTAWPQNRLIISCRFLYTKVLQQPFVEPGNNVWRHGKLTVLNSEWCLFQNQV